MKKLTVLATLAILVAGAAFAAPAKVAPNASNFYYGAPATTNNDESCDISVMPAATLLLPYFEVAEDPTGETTLFTITNVSAEEQIAHVVLWTDYSYPVIDFNIYLTGYDVQAINLNDVIWRGVIAPASGDREDNGTGTDISPGDWYDNNDLIDTSNCDGLAGDLPDFYVQRMQDAFTLGTVDAVPGFPGSDCDAVGNAHGDVAIGYATVDVALTCGTGLPTDGDDYFEDEIGFDNVLIGDYQQVNSDNDFAQGNPMVHIKAVPEGGYADYLEDGTYAPDYTNFDRTFYSRYQTDGFGDGYTTLDRRQPLPSIFAARWINGGDTDFETSLKIWREGIVIGTDCDTAFENGELLVTESVIFDEDENGEGIAGDEIIISPPIGTDAIVLPETSRTSIADEDVFAQGLPGIAGWVYLNLDNGMNAEEDYPYNMIASQNWVVVSMRAEGRYSVDFDAAALGNGCTPVAPVTEFTEGGDATLGPADNDTGCISCVLND